METKEIPILLLTGYLGSGKTTLLHYLLSTRASLARKKRVWWLYRTAASAVPSVPTLSNRYLS